jgi:hypothetical protein
MEFLVENGGFEQLLAHSLPVELAVNRAVSSRDFMLKCTTRTICGRLGPHTDLQMTR